MLYTLTTLLEILVEERADALHLHPGEKPVVEVTRTLFQVSGPPMEPGDTETLLQQVAFRDELREFEAAGFVSCYHQVAGREWFTFMAFREQNQVRLEIRSVH